MSKKEHNAPLQAFSWPSDNILYIKHYKAFMCNHSWTKLTSALKMNTFRNNFSIFTLHHGAPRGGYCLCLGLCVYVCVCVNNWKKQKKRTTAWIITYYISQILQIILVLLTWPRPRVDYISGLWAPKLMNRDKFYSWCARLSPIQRRITVLFNLILFFPNFDVPHEIFIF